ncbi:MAG: hypothetical protein AAFP85_12895 [Pseudomonadota bacterium]
MAYKSLMLAAGIALAPMAALADFDHIFIDSVQSTSSPINVDLVRSSGDGIIAVYQMRAGEPTRLLGTSPVVAGANADVKVQLSGGHGGNVMVALHAGSDVTGPMLDSEIVDRD